MATTIHPLSASLSPNPKQIVYRISGCDDRVVLINERDGRAVTLHRPNYDSQADRIYRHIIQHPNKRITRKEMEGLFEEKFSMDFTHIVSGLGFKGELRRLFFRVSKNALHFSNPITWDRMQTMQISIEDIESLFPQDIEQEIAA